MTFGKKIANLRNENKLTQDELSKNLGISRSSLALYETDKRSPDINMINLFASFFDVSADYLLGRTENPEDAIINKEELPKELVEAGYDYLVVIKKAKENGLSPETVQELVDLAIKMKEK